MWFCSRGDKYRIQRAVSEDGCAWKRLGLDEGIGVSSDGWDSDMIEYPCVFDHEGGDFYSTVATALVRQASVWQSWRREARINFSVSFLRNRSPGSRPAAPARLATAPSIGRPTPFDRNRQGADIAAWDRDPYSVPPEDLKNLKCEFTLLRGEIVYEMQ